MLDLVPFDYSGLMPCDSVWLNPRMVRFPTEEIGRLFKGDRRPRHPKYYQDLISVIIARHPTVLGSLGIDLMVRGRAGSQGDREYQTRCYSMDEIHDLGIYSTLPGARRYMHIYPKLKEAEILGRLKPSAPPPPAVLSLVENLDAVLAIPDRTVERSQAKENLRRDMGKSMSTVNRYIRKREIGAIPPLRQGRSDKGYFRRFPIDLQAKTRFLMESEPTISTKELFRRLDGQVEYSTLRRFRDAIKCSH